VWVPFEAKKDSWTFCRVVFVLLFPSDRETKAKKISLLFLSSFFFTLLFCFGLHFFLQSPPLSLSFCRRRALVVVVVVVFVLNNNNNVRNIRVLELRGAENEEGNRGEVTRWFETIGISRVRFRRVCHGR
jgi:hypothetical protein